MTYFMPEYKHPQNSPDTAAEEAQKQKGAFPYSPPVFYRPVFIKAHCRKGYGAHKYKYGVYPIYNRYDSSPPIIVLV